MNFETHECLGRKAELFPSLDPSTMKHQPFALEGTERVKLSYITLAREGKHADKPTRPRSFDVRGWTDARTRTVVSAVNAYLRKDDGKLSMVAMSHSLLQ